MSTATAPSLRTFLEQPTRPAGTLTYDELQGFLFAVISAPEPIQPSEWLPIIFNEHDSGYATLEEAQLILGHIRALDNLDDSAPLARWSGGFLRRILLT